MSDSSLADIIQELLDAEQRLKTSIEQSLGKVDTTDFSDEYQEFSDALEKLKSLATQEAGGGQQD